ncbi:MAG: hypothetical protein N2645_20020 [Clostridia bacterium]|nr:hypothetical protein [Clostridia bacterium]
MPGHRSAAGEIYKILGGRDQKSTVAQPVLSEEEDDGDYTDLVTHSSNPDAHHPQLHHEEHEDGGSDPVAVSDSMVGERIIDDSSTPTGNSGMLTSLLGWIAAMIKAVTGKENWRTAPATTLEEANTHITKTTEHLHLACRCATLATITLADTQIIDGVSLSSGDRVLVKNQTDQKENGVYIVATGLWTRAPDFNENSDFTVGVFVYISEGIVNKKKLFHLTTTGQITIGTSVIVFENIDQGGGAGSGDMTKSVYDPDEDGVVESAEHALVADNAGHSDTADLALTADTALDSNKLEGHPAVYFAKNSELLLYASEIDFYIDGVIITFADASIANYTWVKDELGRITSLSNTTPEPDEVTSVTYHPGTKP